LRIFLDIRVIHIYFETGHREHLAGIGMKAYNCILISVFFAVYSASATIINIPAEYPTIQQGIDASVDGDTVLVKPGIYIENVGIDNKNVVLASYFLTTSDTSYIPITIIDGDSSFIVLRLWGVDSGTAVIGFTIRNGRYTMHLGGAGISCIYSGNPVISHNIIEDNYFGGASDIRGGGGIGCLHSEPVIEYNSIINNRVDGLGWGGGIFCHYSSATIKNNVIWGNLACWGGGIGFYNSDPIIVNNMIYDNDADP
jgi:hypothetical protein